MPLSPHTNSQNGDRGRNGAVDLVRFAGALAIVWFHEGMPYHFITYAALPVFMALLIYFALCGRQRESSTSKRAVRPLVPWIAWSIIYGLLKIADAVHSGAPIASEFEYWMLLTGTKIHLWFLPAAFFAGWVLCALAPAAGHRFAFWPLLGLYFVVQAGMCFVLTRYSFEWPFYQWLFVAPACLLGLVLYAAGGDRIRLMLILAVAIIAYRVTSSFVWWHGSIHGLIAAAACAIALLLPFRGSRLTGVLSGISLGIYLVHPFVHAVLLRLPLSEPGTIAFTILVVAGSILLTLALQQAPLLRRIV